MSFYKIRGKVSGERNTAIIGNTSNSHNPVKYIYNLASNPKRTTNQTIQLLAAAVLSLLVLAGVVVGLVFLVMGMAQRIGGSSKSGANSETSTAAPSTSLNSTTFPTLSATPTPGASANSTPTQTPAPVTFPWAAYSDSPYRTSPPPFLTQAKNYGNCDACDKCNNSTAFINDCHKAVNLFVDDEGYVNHTRLVAGNCYADWTCNGEYTKKLGKDIKNVFNYGIFGNAGCESCGQWFLMDGSNCHGTIQAVGC